MNNSDQSSNHTLPSFGNDLLDPKFEVKSVKDVKAEVIIYLFSASWCPPCQKLTPMLAQWYNYINSSSKRLEIIFFSACKSEDNFREYYKKMPWLTIRYNSSILKEYMTKYQINSFPSLIVLDGKFSLIESKGYAVLGQSQNWVTTFDQWAQKKTSSTNSTSQNKTSSNFPNFGKDLIDHKKNVIEIKDIKAEIFVYYFSASWCGPCQKFTPKLAEWYKFINNTTKRMEMIFISGCQSEEDFNEYFSKMPFLAIQFESDSQNELMKKYQIKGFPTIIIFDRNFNILETDGYRALAQSNNWVSSFEKWANLSKPSFDEKEKNSKSEEKKSDGQDEQKKSKTSETTAISINCPDCSINLEKLENISDFAMSKFGSVDGLKCNKCKLQDLKEAYHCRMCDYISCIQCMKS